jgi:hypothetical protein
MPGGCRPQSNLPYQRLDLLARLLDVPVRQRGEAVHERAVALSGVRQKGGQLIHGVGAWLRGGQEARPLGFRLFERLLRAGG